MRVGRAAGGWACPAAEPRREGALELRRAGPSDDDDIRRLLRAAPMEGWVRMSFPREPSWAASLALEGGRNVTLVARRGGDGELVAMGSRSVKDVWWGGAPARVGYLGQLRAAAGHRIGRRTLARGFEMLRGAGRPDEAPFDLTAVVADNAPARRLLERGLPGLPRYTPLTELVTLVIATGGRGARRGRDPSVDVALGSGRLDDAPDLAAFESRLAADRRAFGLAPRWTPEKLTLLAGGGLGAWTPLVACENGRVTGTAAVWDQRSFRQCVVAGYAPRVRRLRPLLNVALRLARRPRLPPAGNALAMGYVSHLSADDPGTLRALVAEARVRGRRLGLDQLALGLAADRPELDVLQRAFGGHVYRSVLYAVHAPDRAPEPPGPPAGPPGSGVHVEVATL